ncbi:MAG: hypothetical protein LW650_05685 [Planctomycetaceae bacterium]|jgi:hypothetical protein|nr:hypothetical protein [Phycisphaerales bacterium]MCE2652996.1 hypothetical protein [Planctomycetaceae bacterium]
MLLWLRDQYAKRIVNINVNITVAAVMAMSLAALTTQLAHLLGVNNEKVLAFIMLASDWLFDLVIAVGLHWLANHWPRRWKRSRLLIDRADSVIDAAPPTGVSIIKDVAAATHLHKDHGQPRTGPVAAATRPAPGTPEPGRAPLATTAANGAGVGTAAAERSFVKDATIIQLQRLCLSPLFYLVAVGGHWAMMTYPFLPVPAGLVPFTAAVVSYGTAIIITRLIHTAWLLKTDRQVLEEWEEARQRRQANNLPAAVAGSATTAPATAALPAAVTMPPNGAMDLAEDDAFTAADGVTDQGLSHLETDRPDADGSGTNGPTTHRGSAASTGGQG